MKHFDAHAPGRLTVIAALLAGLSGTAMASSPDLVISQLYGAGGNANAVLRNDFVEIFNRGAVPVSLSGKYLQYAATGGSNWSVAALPSAVTLQPGQFALMQLASGGQIGAVLPTPDGSSGSINMAGAAGKIVLSTQSTAYVAGTVNPAVTFPATVVDLVGFGAATTASEGAPTPNLSAATAARRINACIDTDSNVGDFEVVAPNPRNTASAATPCGGEPPAQPIALTCPATLTVGLGFSASALLSATDPDSIVTSAVITSGAIPGISLLGFTAATEDGGVASVNLDVSASAAAGVYPVVVNFGNNEAQQKSCTVNVTVQGPFAVTRTIPQIQGNGAKSPFQNTTQTTEGVVTKVVSSGFFLQDPVGDNDSSTSDGIFVFMSTTQHGLAAGDLARVTGTVTEFTPTGAGSSYTEIKDTIQILKFSSGNSVTPTNVSALDQLEAVEGMLVNISTPLTVNQNAYLGERGELTLSVGRRETPTNRYPAGSPGALALAAANAVNEITLDDGIFVTPNKAPYIGVDATVRSGDTVTGLTGVVDFGALGGGGAGYKLQPTETPLFSRTNARDLAPVVAPGNLRVASANVLNYFTITTKGLNVLTGLQTAGCKVGNSTTLGNCRGADSMAEYIRQRDKIVNELKAIDADVVGLMEIQNNGDEAATALVGALNTSIGFPAYAVVPAPPATGTDAIRVAMIYKPASVALPGPAMSDDNSINNRPPMAQTFKHPNGAKFSVVVNHLKSKGSCGGGVGNTDSGDGQGCWNLARVQQANRLANVFLPQVVATSGDSDVLVIGDLNSHGFEDPINVLTGSGLVNELERFVRPHGIVYSYVFDGASGYLDHALASASLDAQVAGAMEWHNNADEPTVIDYDIDGKPAGEDLYVNNAFRASDHDPVVISLNLTPTYADLTSSFTVLKYAATLNRATGKYTGKVTFKNSTASTINGPFHVSFSGLTAGVTVDGASGVKDGAAYLTAGDASLAPGATATVNVTFTNPAKAAIGYSNIIYSGNF